MHGAGVADGGPSDMTTREQLRDYIFDRLIPTPADARPEDDADLLELGLDSLRIMQLLVFIEEKIGVNLPDHEVTEERIGSLSALVDWIQSHLAAASRR